MTATNCQFSDWAIVIVNWNNWPDTLECLEGVMRLDNCHARVILVDNASTDDSVVRFLQWANGELCIIPESRDSMVSSLVKPPIKKPLNVTRIGANNSWQPVDSPNGHGKRAALDDETRHARFPHPTPPQEGEGANESLSEFHVKSNNRLFLLTANENCGFAAGNNLGIRFALNSLGCNIFWLINNDAVPQREAFRELQSMFEGHNHPLVCGTAIMDYHNPTKVQSCGGLFDFHMGLASHKFDGWNVALLDKQPAVVKSTYPVGASLAVHQDFISLAGFMDEGLFLYYEELTWIISKGKPFEAPISTRSRVFHKGSSSTGFSQDLKKRNASIDYYLIRNRLLIGRQLGLLNLACFIAATSVGLIKRLLTGRYVLVLGGLKATFDGLTGKTGRR